MSEEINFLHQTNADDSNASFIVDTSSMEIGSLARALYATHAKYVVIILTDIVGFSKMVLDMKPFEVINMLQGKYCSFSSLFHTND